MITPKDYLMGRDKAYPLDMTQALNMANLLSRLNHLFGRLKIDVTVSSGYRPAAINAAVKGAKRSAHMSCEAIDLYDPKNEIGIMLKNNVKLLEEYDLYLETPSKTPGWLHLQTRRVASGNRVFHP